MRNVGKIGEFNFNETQLYFFFLSMVVAAVLRWYTCPQFGLTNFSTWLRVGPTGFTFLPSTEHKGLCSIA